MKRFLTVLLLLILVSGMAFAEGQGEKKSISVGSKNFTEQYIVSEIIAMLLENNGFDVSRDFGMSTTVVRNALTTGQVDLYAEYTGTAWATFLEQEEPIRDPDLLFQKVAEMDKDSGIEWLFKLDINNTYAMAVPADFADQHNLKNLEDLADLVNENPGDYTFAIDFEFYERADGFFAMAEHYGMDIPKDARNVKTMEIGLSYEAVDQGDVDIAMVFATDGKIKKFDMVVLKDNKNFFPVYSLCPTMHEDAYEMYPEVEKILMPLQDLLDETTMINLNYLVDAQNMEPEEVAEQFLTDNGLID
jgi:osmoprotectant transport system substrate-binding protein